MCIFIFSASIAAELRGKAFWSAGKFVLASSVNCPEKFPGMRSQFAASVQRLRGAQTVLLCALSGMLKTFVPEDLEIAKEVSAKFLSETDDFLRTCTKIEPPEDLHVPFFALPEDPEFSGERNKKFSFVTDEEAPSDLSRAFRIVEPPKNVDYSVA